MGNIKYARSFIWFFRSSNFDLVKGFEGFPMRYDFFFFFFSLKEDLVLQLLGFNFPSPLPFLMFYC